MKKNDDMTLDYELLDNGCTISDLESNIKNCVECNTADDYKRIHEIFGCKLYDGLIHFAEDKKTSQIRINIKFEDIEKL